MILQQEHVSRSFHPLSLHAAMGRSRRCVIEAVMLLKKDENATNANNRTRTEKERSVVFVACTSMLAGVNWVNDQCKLVVYLQATIIHFRLFELITSWALLPSLESQTCPATSARIREFPCRLCGQQEHASFVELVFHCESLQMKKVVMFLVLQVWVRFDVTLPKHT
eukprot:795955-Amphidinium_carterae.2